MLPQYFLDYLAELAGMTTQELAHEFDVWTTDEEAPASLRDAAVRRILALDPAVEQVAA